MKRNKLRRVTATALLLSFALPQCAQAAAPTVETDETVYINMDYYGAPTNTRIVKGVNLNGHTEFTDFGDYKDVYNMSTFDEPTLKEDSVYWKLNTDKNRFYYECIPNDTVNIQMPWNFDVSYKLNGVPVEADQCAGASGTIQMDIHAVPNTYASDYYKNNMMLVCATGIDMSKALSIDAPGAQIQSFGTYKLVMFMGLPGEENTFTVRIGSNDFESMGLIMFMTPATTSALDIMSSMRDIKDRLENSGDNLYTGVSSMLSTMQAVQGSLSSMSSGISGIDQVRKQLIKDRGTLDPRTDAALNALDELTGKSDSLIPELNSAKETLTALNATTSSILTTLEESGEDIPEYQKLLNDVKTSLGNLENLFDDLDDETDNSSWTIAQIRSASEDLSKELEALTKDLKSLSGSLDDLDLETPVSTELKNYVSAMTSSTAQSAGKDASQKKYLEIMSTITRDMSDEEKAEIEEKAKAEAAKAGEAAGAAAVQSSAAYNNAQALAALMTGIKSGSSAVTSDMQSMTKQLKSVTEEMSDLLNATNSLLKDLEDIADVFDEYKGLPQDFTAEGKKLTELANGSLDRVNKMLADIPALRESLDSLTKTATASIDKTTDLMSSTTKALSTSYDLMNTANSVLRSVRSQADASTQTTIDSLLDTLGKLSGSTASGQMQTATNSIHSAVKDAETDLEDDTNVLNIDTSADLESVTSSMNPSPSSLQFILRTEEISVDDDDDDGISDQDAADEGVFARICNIFKKLFTAITGVFASDD
ncbi:Mce/MlaD family protein [Agathobaculum hominis]|uniref:X-X-X-Leu-X-X-Gly heptad repeat-containing protein n=1 Tax=Agathobaculum hominis TaxID=2763014 RepID=A0ABR7GQC2_9FIRM|nr:hypothetical protein [Agathobaculum hominis]MBC5696523.1 hypothetical protein [Agathobaculum hominis]